MVHHFYEGIWRYFLMSPFTGCIRKIEILRLMKWIQSVDCTTFSTSYLKCKYFFGAFVFSHRMSFIQLCRYGISKRNYSYISSQIRSTNNNNALVAHIHAVLGCLAYNVFGIFSSILMHIGYTDCWYTHLFAGKRIPWFCVALSSALPFNLIVSHTRTWRCHFGTRHRAFFKL